MPDSGSPRSPSSPSPASADVPRTALVTGAAKRLGREIALGLAAQGWDIAVHYGQSADDAATTVAQIRAMGRRAVAVQADLADEARTLAMFDEARSALGPIGCLVNNASRFEFDAPESFGYAALDAHLRSNLAAPLALSRRLHESLPGEARGVVINLLDQKLGNLNPDFFSYTLSKAGLAAATRMMAMAFAPKLRVVGVSPGITLVSGDQTEQGFERAHRKTPLGRSSRPEDIVRAVAFLADAPAITGIDLVVDGGQHLLGLPRDVMYLEDA
ncbi:MAG: 3-oxoacyl-(acyl-carrier-protein) reductase [Pseudomonadota bacterium]|jgi:NAD(P)-dependent dehydrogenase (short-subunit alcohol dehydrogenase family)